MRPQHPLRMTVGLIALAGTAGLMTDGRWVFPYLPYFCLGWAGAWCRFVGFERKLPWAVMAAVLAILIACVESLWMTGAAVFAILFILFWKWPVARVWATLGSISYSLYLVHVPLGGRVVNLLGRYVSGGGDVGGGDPGHDVQSGGGVAVLALR